MLDLPSLGMTDTDTAHTTFVVYETMTRIYVRDELYQWLPATLLTVEKDRVCIEVDWLECATCPEERFGAGTTNIPKEVKWLDVHDFQANSLPRGNTTDADCGDIARLDVVNEAEIMYYLMRRFLANKMFARCCDQLLVLHPLTLSSSFCTDDTKTKYFDHYNGTSLLPFPMPLMMFVKASIMKKRKTTKLRITWRHTFTRYPRRRIMLWYTGMIRLSSSSEKEVLGSHATRTISSTI
jgi:hypothetical protein